MSYDVSIGNESFNYTFNCSAVFYDHIPDTGKGGGLREIIGLTGKDAAIVLAASFARMDQTRHNLWKNGVIGEPEMCARYDAVNGWGSLIGAILFVGMILDACIRNPRKKVDIWM